MQITPILVAECNDILKRRKSKKRFTLSDRFSIAKSKEMFLLIQSVHNPLNSIEHAIRAWNGGNHYSVKRTQRYFEKVMNLLKSNWFLICPIYSSRMDRIFVCSLYSFSFPSFIPVSAFYHTFSLFLSAKSHFFAVKC